MKILNPNQVITDLEKLLHRLIGEDIELVSFLDPSLGYVKADKTQLEQIILNLAINSRDAMPKGGKLSIETRNVFLDQEYASTHPGSKTGTADPP